MPSILSVSVEADDLREATAFWQLVLRQPAPAVLTWALGAGSAFFELSDGVRLIISAPRKAPPAEWLGIELFTDDPDAERKRLDASGVPVSAVYDTDGGSRAFVVTGPEGQKFRVGTRWPLPTTDRDLTGASGPRERDVS